MSLIACRECGNQISDQAKSCPHCGCPVPPQQPHIPNQPQQVRSNNNNQPQKGESVVGIIGLILSLFICSPVFSFLAFILCLIGLFNKNHKKVCATIGICLSVIGILISILAPQYLKYVEKAKQENISNESNTNSPASLTTNINADDGIIDFEKNGCCLKYLKHEISENAAGDKCIVVFYEFTNNSSETTSYIYTFSDQAFQNGIELEKSIFLMDDIEDNRSKDIRPGISVEVYSLFKPQDNSIVDLEVSEWISLSDKPADTMQLSLE